MAVPASASHLFGRFLRSRATVGIGRIRGMGGSEPLPSGSKDRPGRPDDSALSKCHAILIWVQGPPRVGTISQRVRSVYPREATEDRLFIFPTDFMRSNYRLRLLHSKTDGKERGFSGPPATTALRWFLPYARGGGKKTCSSVHIRCRTNDSGVCICTG